MTLYTCKGVQGFRKRPVKGKRCRTVKRSRRVRNKSSRNPLKELVGNVYRNFVTGNEWKMVKVKNRLITLRDKYGMEFNTTPELMGNYSYVGKKFTR